VAYPHTVGAFVSGSPVGSTCLSRTEEARPLSRCAPPFQAAYSQTGRQGPHFRSSRAVNPEQNPPVEQSRKLLSVTPSQQLAQMGTPHPRPSVRPWEGPLPTGPTQQEVGLADTHPLALPASVQGEFDSKQRRETSHHQDGLVGQRGPKSDHPCSASEFERRRTAPLVRGKYLLSQARRAGCAYFAGRPQSTVNRQITPARHGLFLTRPSRMYSSLAAGLSPALLDPRHPTLACAQPERADSRTTRLIEAISYRQITIKRFDCCRR
jgi:hypothetical protein